MSARAWLLSAALLVLAAWAACPGCSRENPSAGAAKPAGLAADERIAWLLASRTHSEPFLGDTSDLVPALISKLASGQSDPLAQAKLDLAAAGARALPALRQFFESCYGSETLVARVINALDTAALMPEGLGRPLLLRGLDHPMGSARVAALRGLVHEARPEDYERLRTVGAITGAEGQLQLAQALWRADPGRVVHELPGWIEGAMPGGIVLALGTLIARCEDHAALLALKPLLPKVTLEFGTRLRAALAKAGDEESLQQLRAMLADPAVEQREQAAKCLHEAGLQRELLPVLRGDGALALRELAAQALSELPFDDELRAALEAAAGDPAVEVRGMALTVLVGAHDPLGENEALALLKGDRSELERGLLVLREALKTRRELAERALAVLDGLRTGAIGPLRVERSSIWRAIAQIPLEAAARILFDELEHQPSPDRNFSAHRWFVTQIGNTGPEGLRLVRQRWRSENDPQRRVDLLNASCYDRGEEGRKFLEEAIDSQRMTPLELLYAAQQLASMGPAERVAPRLKRMALGVQDKAVRPALNHLLWTWYGLES